MKQVFSLLLLVFFQNILVFGQSRIQISGLLNLKDPIEYKEGVFSQNGAPIVVSSKQFSDNLSAGFALGVWSRNGDVLHEFEYVGKKGTLKNWKYLTTSGEIDTFATLKRLRYSFQYSFFYNLLPQNRRFALFPGLAIRPIYNLYNYQTLAPNGFPAKIENFGADAVFVPRLMFRIWRGFYVDASVEVARARFRVEKDSFENNWTRKSEYSLATSLTRLGVGYWIGW